MVKFMKNLNDRFITDESTKEITKITIDENGIHTVERDIVA